MSTGLVAAGGEASWEQRRARLDTLVRQREVAEAAAVARELLAELEAAGQAGSAEVLRLTDVLVRSLRSSGESRSPEALALAERGLQGCVGRYGRSSPEAARAMVTLADILTDRHQLERSGQLLDEALAVLSAASPRDELAIADIRRARGNLELAAGDPIAARDDYREALATTEALAGPESPESVELLRTLAGTTRRAGDLAAAADLGQRAVEGAERVLGPDHQETAGALNSYALTLRDLGDLAGARRCLERALAIWEKTYGPDDPRVAGLLNNLGNLTRRAGDLRSARGFLERSLAIRERTVGPDHPDIAQSLGNLALVAMESGDLEGALVYQERALVIRERALGPDHPDVALILVNVGEVLKKLGRLEEARLADERALRIRNAVLGPEHPLVAESLHNLAIILGELDEVAAGRDMAVRALELWRRTYGPGHPRTAIATLTLARLDVLAGRFDAALDGALRAEDLARDVLSFNARQLAEREALQLADARVSGRHLAMTLLASGESTPQGRRRVWEAVARSRALVLAAATARRRLAGDDASPMVRAAAAELESSRARLADTLVRAWSKPSPAQEDEVAAARAEAAAAERALAAASPAFAHEIGAAALALDQVSTGLPPKAALVSIVRYRADAVLDHRRRLEAGLASLTGPRVEAVPSYLAFILSGGNDSPAVVPLGPAETIDAAVERWTREAARGPRLAGRTGEEAAAAYRAEGEELRRLVWDPVGARLGEAGLVLVVADGALHGVGWSALPAGPDRYLVDTGPVVHRLTAERDVLELQRGHEHGRGLLALGDVSYDAAASRRAAVAHDASGLRGVGGLCGSLAGRAFEPLPASAAEVAAVAEIWRQDTGASHDASVADVVLLTGDGATEAAFRNATGSRRVLHLATHGFTLTGRCETPEVTGLRGIGGLAAAPGASPPATGAVPAPGAATAVEDGLELGVLAGLALAGANRRDPTDRLGDDGILTAEEIANLDLDGVEWVVLSACDTAAGEVRFGEGVIGLARAFRIAGAHTVIMSLWAVEDASARAFMEALYRARFRDRLSTPEAMDAAARSLLELRRRRGLSTHPFHWAGFVATGDWS